MTAVDPVVGRISDLPHDWHGSGTVTDKTVRALARHLEHRDITVSAETGCGRSTLLFSRRSRRHTVFTMDDTGHTDSLARVRGSELLEADRVEFVTGPTQTTLPAHRFDGELDAVMLDGPHAYPFVQLEYFYLYPHLAPGALLVVDDIHIPTVNHLWRFLVADEMFERLEIVDTTGFLQRTSASTFPPLLDGWEHQAFNRRRFPSFLGPLTWLRGLKVRRLL